MATTPLDLESIISGAMENSTEIEVPEPGTDPESEETPVVPVVEKTEVPVLDEFGLTAEEQKTGRQLAAALKDPAKAKLTIEYLTKQAGFTLAQPETKQEVKQVVKDLKSVLKEKMGPDLEYLSDTLGPAIDDYVKGLLEATAAPLRQTQEQQSLREIQKDTDTAIAAVGQKYFSGSIPDNLAEAMTNLYDEIPLKAGVPAEKHLERLLKIAAADLGVTLKVGTPATALREKVLQKNRTDAPARLASAGGPSPKEGQRTSHPTKQMELSLEDSVRKALSDTQTTYAQD